MPPRGRGNDRSARPRARRVRGFTLFELSLVVAILAAVAGMVVVSFGDIEDQAELTVARTTLQELRGSLAGSAGAPGLIQDLKFLPGFDPAVLRLSDLFGNGAGYPPFDPATQRGWRGPYAQGGGAIQNESRPEPPTVFPAAAHLHPRFTGSFQARGFYGSSGEAWYGQDEDLACGDPWGNPIVLQVPPVAVFGSPSVEKQLKYARLVSAGADGVLDAPRDRTAGRLADGTASARGDDLVLFLYRTDAYEPE
ncbi:MAG: type II secretion system protein [Planctomycetes bacterium]|nr:type II secretion system protein [Planctomycetota bacterium]